ncbi:piggyBac transposable element-derived protein 4 isoform X3 [Danio rerio]|uniref:PiggyBac transposable element-derived protein 4 isoform X3 n=2 Tax=Danio rerio TaxID=7955 RepID=A0A8M9PXB2_DANRE|nr:piggyBac transposable element-derived protein 4-like isoform X2 [Danio rerio]|eukprot:XP_009305219.2 piggyBac transposable element-derived protein 4-like isoform X2 [Danio rerio]
MPQKEHPCAFFECKAQHKSLHRLPSNERLRRKWLSIIFEDKVPENLPKLLYVCANHFSADSFENAGQFNSGFASKLFLKTGSVPTRRDPTLLRRKLVPVVPAVAVEGFHASASVPKKNTTNNADCIVGSDEELDFCDQDSVASSVDSSAEDMFIDDMDPILDRPSSDLYLPEEDYDSKDAPQHRKRLCLSSAEGGDRKSENGFYWTETEKWQSSDEADVEPPLLVFTPNQNPGPQILPNRCSSALQFFQLLFPKSMFQTIAGYTNSYAAKYEERKGKLWNFISQSDMKSYVALVIYMGMFRCSSLSDYWSESQHFSLSFPAKIMSYRKFLSISKVLHLSESREDEKNILKKGTAGYERLGKIQPLYQVIRESCKSYFHPFQNITIVERMVKPQAGTGLKQSLKSRSPNMGFKLFALTDCTCGYTWDFFVYEGKSCASRSEGLSYETVMALVDENMLGSGYKLFVDKFYTSPTLFTDLLDKKVLACGPVWPNRTGYPKSAKNKLLSNAPRGTMRWIRQDKLLFVEWKDSKEVQMCSSFHKAYEGDTVQRKVRRDAHRTLEEIPVPAVVLDYSKNMEAVDSSDCITEHFRAIHKPKKWYQCMFYHFLDIAVENAFIMQELVTKGNGKKPLTRKAFLQALILELTDIDSLDSAAVPLTLSSSG